MFDLSKLDWGLIVGIGQLIIAIIALFFGGKKLYMKISPKTKSGDINMSKSTYISEKHTHYHNERIKK